MVRLIITPEITNRTSWGKTSKLVQVTRNMSNIEILYALTLDAQTTAQGLKERITRLNEVEGLRNQIWVREAEFLSKGNAEIIKYLESKADREAQDYIGFRLRRTSNLIFVLEQKVSNTLPNEIWIDLLKAKYGGIPKFEEGQAVFFNFKKSCAQSAMKVYGTYSCTALF